MSCYFPKAVLISDILSIYSKLIPKMLQRVIDHEHNKNIVGQTCNNELPRSRAARYQNEFLSY